MMRSLLRRSATAKGLLRDFDGLAARKGLVSRHSKIRQYFRTHESRRLQIGAGPTLLDGWLSADINPVHDEVIYMDATRKFPFDSGAFDFVYTEHMVEHVPWLDGLALFAECRRVLRRGGVLRVATPDMTAIAALAADAASDANVKYINWIAERYLGSKRFASPGFVVNTAFRGWGHQFLYDENTLRLALEEAGFGVIRRCAYGASSRPELANLESHGANVQNEEMAAFESLILEAEVPV